jgi:hypothetical protein
MARQHGGKSEAFGCYNPEKQLLGSFERLKGVSNRVRWAIFLFSAAALVAAYDPYFSAKQKFNQIEAGQLRAGTRLELSPPELNAYIAKEAPNGVRDPKILVVAPGVVTGTALVDFNKLQRAQGQEPGWLMSKLLQGEHPVSVTTRVQSASGKATVNVDKVEISGVKVDGRTLEFIIQNVVIPNYPDVMIGRPFELGYHISRLDVKPAAVGILIGR